MKEENANYIFVIYTDYNGTELTITHLKMQSTTISFVFLGILGGFIILLICVCFCWYKFCKKKQKKELDGQYQSVFLGLEYKNTIDI
jgi:cytochrome bd-type quinol oxidase subunit 2